MRSRSPFSVALALLIAVPVVARSASPRRGGASRAPAPAEAPAPSTRQQLSVGGFVGWEIGKLDGPALRLDGELPIRALSPKVTLSGVGSVGYSHLSKDTFLGKTTWNVFSIAPAARFTGPVAPKTTLYGDAGVGLYYGRVKTEQGALASASSSHTGFLLRFAAGGFYQVNPKARIGAELGVKPHLGKIDTATWTLSVGAMFAL